VAATNLKMDEAIAKEKFREDLYYRLSTVEINLPPLRERKEDITLLFRKFAADFAQKYKMPTLRLDEGAQKILQNYYWNGNIRQLRNVAEQLSVLEKDRLLSSSTLNNYLPKSLNRLPALIERKKSNSDFSSEREILYKVLFDMKGDLNDLKKLTLELMQSGNSSETQEKNHNLIQKIYQNEDDKSDLKTIENHSVNLEDSNNIEKNSVNELKYDYAETVIEEEPLSLLEREIEMIKKALIRSKGKRKNAAKELGISERTLYRKIKQHNLNELEE
jgi:DNA-binding NtrC family response regulator